MDRKPSGNLAARSCELVKLKDAFANVFSIVFLASDKR